jgi:LacI family transcriptional regulator
VGFLHRLLREGLRIPEAVSVVGTDDTPLAAAAAVPLSTVKAPVEQIGRQAVRRLLDSSSVQTQSNVIPAWEWVGRESTRNSLC